MTRNVWTRVSGLVVGVGLAAPFMTHCAGNLPGAESPGGAAGCPDMARAEAIASFDFEKAFTLRADVAARIKAGAEAAAEISALDDKIEADLTTACGNLARDLGAQGDFKGAQTACEAADRAIAQAKTKLGAKAKIDVEVVEPHCGVDVNAYADCAGHCDASVKGGKAEVKCEPGKLQGQCSAKCQGECDVETGAQCTGECSGSCDAEMKGACSGKCTGKCDGKAMPAGANGRCDGVCDGRCDAEIHGECKGKCSGSCKLKAEAECKGTCTGSCSAEMQAPRCVGKVEPAQVSAECKAKCDAGLQAKAECSPAHVTIRIKDPSDLKTAAMFQQAIEKDLGPLLKVAVGTGRAAERIAGDTKTILDAVAAGAQGASDALNAARLTACIAAPFKHAVDAASHIQANVSVSVKVEASASARAG